MISRRLFCFLLIAPAAIQAELSELDLKGKIPEIERRIVAEMAHQQIPGMSIAIAAGESVFWTNGYGLSDLENNVPAKANTVFRTASLAKPITAVAIMQLVERGLLDLDSPVQHYLPDFPVKKWPITPRQLLAHLGGIRWYKDDVEANNTHHYFSLAEALRLFQDDPLAAEPGTKFVYSTYGFVLLGRILEQVTGTTYLDYVRTNVFTPAGMYNTRADNVYAVIPNRSRGYVKSGLGEISNCALADTSGKIPGGGLLATSQDMANFALAVGRGKLLKPASVDAMFTPQRTRDGKSLQYGLGWDVNSLDGHLQTGHIGGQAGTATILRYLPHEKIAVAMMFNLQNTTMNELADEILRILLKPPV
jgi:CubicO group peptidase (beta-lactamase class C family)